MSKQAIAVGQQWTEKEYSLRVGEVVEVLPNGARVRIVSAKPGAKFRPETVLMFHVLRAAWSMTKEAPDAPRRRISLVLAADTTASECGSCPKGSRAPHPLRFCDQFNGLRDVLDSISPRFLRLPQCIAAEVRS